MCIKMSNMCITFIPYLLLLFLFKPVFLQSEDLHARLSLQCQKQTKSCSECLNFHSDCSWCYDMDFKGQRCDLEVSLLRTKCKQIHKGKQSNKRIIEDLPLHDVLNTSDVINAVQIRPQRVQLSLRPGNTETIPLEYKAAKNYPLDLYYLIDATITMKDDIETIAALGDKLTHSLSQLTEYFRVGFGTFSDKQKMPFARMDKESIENPCRDTELGYCVPNFGFRNNFNLSSNVKEFIQKINMTEVTGNVDNAEGALDALMQVVVCNEIIGWKTMSRKLILVLTNGLLHFAGDGKLAGITLKNDGLCHLNTSGLYTYSDKQDYPSLEEIYRKLKKHKINVIFAVTEEVFNHYQKLNDVIADFSYVTQLHSDSSNVLSVIKKGFKDAVSIVTFQDNSQGPITVKYSSDCNKQTPAKNKTNSCYNVKVGEKYEFSVDISLDKCPSDPKLWKQTIVIDETHLDTESLVVEIEMLCGCNCSNTENTSSEICTLNGKLECGICQCNSGWSGENCQCDVSNYENTRVLEDKCREITENSTSNMCHGRGECVCGKCLCDSLYDGEYCECEKCAMINGHQCGGPRHGVCDCGKCLCDPDFTGPNCICPVSTDNCIPPGSTEACSDHGKCQCGKCICNKEPVYYSGTYCEKCSTCDGFCPLCDACARCTIQNTCKDECASKLAIEIVFVDSLHDTGRCLVKVNNTYCQFWEYDYVINNENNFTLSILTNPCKPPIDVASLGIIAFVSVVVIGLLTIVVYKFKLRMAYKRELAAFEEEIRNQTKYCVNENPEYKSPVTSYPMPDGMKFD